MDQGDLIITVHPQMLTSIITRTAPLSRGKTAVTQVTLLGSFLILNSLLYAVNLVRTAALL